MNRIIVTGGCGFIGSNFVNYVTENTDYEIVVVDNMTYAANEENLTKKVPIIKKSVCDVTSEDLGEFDYIVHFAAESHVDNSIKDGKPFVRTNVEGTFNLLEIARKNKKLKKFIHISTDEVYGDVEKSSVETDNLVPSSYYSSTKAASDLLVLSAHRTYGLPYIITRTCNNYGENQHREKFLPTLIRSITEDKEIPVYGDGLQVREWIYVKDNVKAIYNIMKSDQVNQVFNIGTGERYQNLQIVKMVSQFLNKEVKYKYVTDRLGHDRRYSLDSTKYENFFGKVQSVKFDHWLEKTIKSI